MIKSSLRNEQATYYTKHTNGNILSNKQGCDVGVMSLCHDVATGCSESLLYNSMMKIISLIAKKKMMQKVPAS